jgi:hypothetical protein
LIWIKDVNAHDPDPVEPCDVELAPLLLATLTLELDEEALPPVVIAELPVAVVSRVVEAELPSVPDVVLDEEAPEDELFVAQPRRKSVKVTRYNRISAPARLEGSRYPRLLRQPKLCSRSTRGEWEDRPSWRSTCCR